jgi:UDPglucose 6-dehydrogenase
VLTDWEEFAELDMTRIRRAMKYPLLMDGRNLYSPERMRRLGFYYVSVGRPDVAPAEDASAREPGALTMYTLPPELPKAS